MSKYEKVNSYFIKRLKVGINVDVQKRKVNVDDKEFSLFFLSSLVDNYVIIDIINSLKLVNNKEDFNKILVGNISYENSNKQVIDLVLEGNCLVVFPNGEMIICDVKKYPSRGISYPEVEKSVRGSKDSFNENIVDNIALIRRRIKSLELNIESFIISNKSKMNVCLIYMNNCDKKNVKLIKSKIKNIDLESLIMADRGLEESIIKQKYNIFPLVRYTERPDVASINLINGKIILLTDTSSNAIILPISIFDHFKNIEEYKQNPLIGSFTKTLRVIGSLISTFLVPLFVLFTIEDGFDNQIIPLYYLKLNNPLLIEITILTLVLEIIRIAIVHTPNALLSSLSLLCAIVLGEVSLSIGLFSSEILLVTSLAVVCNYATPSYELSLANRFVSVVFIIMTCLFKVSGFLVCSLLLFIYLSSIKILDYPYLYPICPFDFEKFKQMFIRVNVNKKK